MEKHKYTQVRLTPVELSALKAFKKGNGNLKLWLNDIPEPLQPVLRQLYRLGFLNKLWSTFSSPYYAVSDKGEAYLNRPRIKIKFRYNRLGQMRITYKVLKGTVYPDKSYQQITRILFLKVV